MNLSKGQRVLVRNDEDGTFIGVVDGFTRDGNVAIIKPDDQALREWFPNGYDIGSVHWGTKVKPLRPTLPPPSDEDREAQAAYDDFWRL